MELYPIREWQEKDGNRLLPSIRLYVGRIHVATVTPTKADPELYTCHNWIDIGRPLCVTTSEGMLLEDIKIAIECSLKEFITRIVKPRKLTPVANKQKEQ